MESSALSRSELQDITRTYVERQRCSASQAPAKGFFAVV
jgi:hypothetical protein